MILCAIWENSTVISNKDQMKNDFPMREEEEGGGGTIERSAWGFQWTNSTNNL